MGLVGEEAWHEHPPAHTDGWQHHLYSAGAEILLVSLPLSQGTVLWEGGVGLLQLRTIAGAVLQPANTLRGSVAHEVCFSFGSK